MLMVLLLGTLAALAVALTDHGLRPAEAQTAQATGTVVACGSNDDGETTVPPAARKRVVVAISAGAIHSLALKNNGSVVAWGFNGYGQSDVPPAAQKGIVAVSDGDFHSLALKDDGSVVAWGDNSFGESTVPAAARSGIIAISAGGFHSLALKEDTTPPNTTITSGPSKLTRSTTATLAFRSNEAGSSFQCRLDRGAFSPCASPKRYTRLRNGSHAFRVRAVDAAGNLDPTPATRLFTVDTRKPTVRSISPNRTARRSQGERQRHLLRSHEQEDPKP